MPKVGTLGLDDDVPHLHGAGEPRLRHRGGHGARSCASRWRCSRWRPRCSPIRRSPRASPTACSPGAREIWPDTDPDRTGMLPFGVRGRHGLRALRRLRARRADVFRLPRRQLHRRRRPVVPRLPGAASCRRCRASVPTHVATGPNHLTTIFPEVRLKRYPRDARRRWRAVAADLRAAGALGRAALRRRRARRRLGPRQGLDRGGARRSCATRCRSSASRPRSVAATCSLSRARRCGSPHAGWRAASSSTATAATRPAICAARGIDRGAA